MFNEIEMLSNIKSHILNNGLFFDVRNSRILYDTRQAILSGSVLTPIGKLMWQKIKKYQPKIICGKGIGSLNVLLAIKFAAESEGFTLEVLFVRDGRKETNRLTIIEGKIPEDCVDAVIVDDLINSGKTIRKCQEVLQQEGVKLNIVAIATVIDFWTFTGSRRFEVTGTPVESLFTRHDFGDTRKDPTKNCFEKLLWRNLDNNQWKFGGITRPLIDNGVVYYANDKHRIYCHDINSGEILWKFSGDKPNQPKGLGLEIKISKEKLFMSSYDGSLYCLNKNNGELIWKKHLDYYIHSSAYIDEENQQLYVGTEGGINNYRGDIVCLDLNTGNTKWRYPTNQVIPCSPCLINGMVICGSNDENLYALDNKTGKLIWIIESIGEIKGRVCDIDGVIIASNQTGIVYGIDYSGQILWKKTIGQNSHHQIMNTDGKMFFVSSQSGSLFAFNSRGEILWYRRLRGDPNWNVTLFGEELIVITTKGHMNVIDKNTGDKKSYTNLNLSVTGPCDFNGKFIAINTVEDGLFLYGR
jgi:outer membrane protein assembly factor BamB/orotate phosphoribosyltransferase